MRAELFLWFMNSITNSSPLLRIGNILSDVACRCEERKTW
jgi:hypothetical protein